jgi:hypothetical protein
MVLPNSAGAVCEGVNELEAPLLEPAGLFNLRPFEFQQILRIRGMYLRIPLPTGEGAAKRRVRGTKAKTP